MSRAWGREARESTGRLEAELELAQQGPAHALCLSSFLRGFWSVPLDSFPCFLASVLLVAGQHPPARFTIAAGAM
eukprot:3941615-Rhodomonas_salina.5